VILIRATSVSISALRWFAVPARMMSSMCSARLQSALAVWLACA
jgi:hypothetical protein